MTVLPDRAGLIDALRAMLIKECDLERAPEEIAEGMPLISEGLELDSLDALQISLAVKEQYGVRIEGGPDARRAFASIGALADFIIDARAKAA